MTVFVFGGIVLPIQSKLFTFKQGTIMKLKCERCGHRWKARGESKPNMCPRCKNKKWETRKGSADCKYGRLYAVILPNGIVKVGQTTTGHKRVCVYKGVKDYTFSGMIYNLNNEEEKFINFAKSICGEPIEGREYFNGDKTSFNKLSAYIKSLGPYEEFDGHADYDFKKVACLIAIERSLPFIESVEKVRLAERSQFYLATKEAFNDFLNGKCDATTAFTSLMEIALNMKNISKDEIEDINIKNVSKKYDVEINEICSQ